MYIDEFGGRGSKYSAKCHYQKIVTKYSPRVRVLQILFLGMCLALYQKHPWHGTIQQTREMYIPIWWHKFIYLETQNKALTTTAQTLGKVWSLEAPHCEGPAGRTSVVQPCGGGDHLVLLLLLYREKEIKVSRPPSLSMSTWLLSLLVKVLSIFWGDMLSSSTPSLWDMQHVNMITLSPLI